MLSLGAAPSSNLHVFFSLETPGSSYDIDCSADFMGVYLPTN